MKVSLKLEDQQQNQTPILFKAKIPITVFGLPFLSGVSATHHHHASVSEKLSLYLRTHFLSGPSLKLAYNTPTNAAAAATAPVSLTLKSGVSLSGSPNNSPLVISANFSFSPQNPNANPTFSIKFTPRLGSFSLRKSISSVSNSSKKLNGGSSDGGQNSYEFVPLDRPVYWKELTVESDTKGSILSGIMMAANTELPVSKRVKLNLRWNVNIPSDYENQLNLPYLRLNKIKVERIDEVNEEKGNRKQAINGGDSDSGEFEMLKGMYSWMSRELNDLQKKNREMRQALEEIKSQQPLKHHSGYNGGGGGKRAVSPVIENSGGFEQWKMKKNGGGVEANVQRETKKNGGLIDVENELQRAIKAASS